MPYPRTIVPAVLLVVTCLCSWCVDYVSAWDSAELEIFDLVEDVGKTTFYELLAVSQDAKTADIRRAYRKQSLIYHPDKNKEDGAEEKFRQVAAVAEILRDEEKRAIYDRVLVEGLPNWQQSVYYYRKVRHMGTVELILAMSLILTVVHYGYLCAVFLEQYYQSEVEMSKRKRKTKKSGKGAAAGDDSEELTTSLYPFPGPLSLLPFAVARRSFTLARNLPGMWQDYAAEKRRQQEEIVRLQQEEAERLKLAEEDAARAAELRQRRVQYKLKQKQDALQDITSADDIDWGRIPNSAESTVEESGSSTAAEAAAPRAKKPWTEEEITALTRAFVRFPGGTQSRWEKIAVEVGRSVNEVTTQIKLLKSRASKASAPVAGPGLESSKRAAQASNRLTSDITVRSGEGNGTIDTAADATGSSGAASDLWSQEQQRLLEKALAKYGKDVANRFERIAGEVPGKTKMECVARCKHIALLVKQRKATGTSSSSASSSSSAAMSR